MRIIKPIYKKNCNWCRYLRYGMGDISECTINGEEILFKKEVLNSKSCANFKCCDSSKTLLDIIKDMRYFKHLKANWKIAFKALLLFIFHFIHGVIPCKYTEHEHWNLKL